MEVNNINVVDAEVVLTPIEQLKKLAEIYETRSFFGTNTAAESIEEYNILSKWMHGCSVK